MGRVVLARPGSTDFDEQKRIVGTLDVPINVRGQAELAEMARELQELPIETVFYAVSEAARQSAEYLGSQLDAKVKPLDGLRNLDCGLWQGLPVDEVRRKHPKVFRQWEECPVGICPPAGEMVEELLERVQKSLKPILRKNQDSLIVIVAPEPLRQAIRCYLCRRGANEFWKNAANGTIWETIEFAD